MQELNNTELISFCSQLAMILHAGISAIEGISIMKEDSPEGEGKEILEKLYEEMEMTGILYESMRQTGVFPEYVCNMTEIGEQTGRLDEVMDGLAAHYENEEALMSSIKSALTYPMIMLGMMTAVILILVIKVMPVFNQVFKELGGGLVGVSRTVMNFGMILSRYGWVIGLIIALIAAGGFYLAFTKKGREALGKRMHTSRMTRDISEKIACKNVADSMNLCIRSGLDIDQSLELSEKLIDHEEMKNKIRQCREQMMEGDTFEEALAKSKLFTGVYGKMVSVGMRTGSMDQVMGKIARQYEDEVTNRLQTVVAAVEPTLVAVLSCLVGLILLSVMLPLMGIMANMG